MAIDANGDGPHDVAGPPWAGREKAQGHEHHEAAAIDGAAMAQLSGLYYAREVTGALQAEHELVKGVCYCCKVAMATGPRGELFAAWRHVYPGNLRDIAFMASREGAGRSRRSAPREPWR
jgi:hypothetical protein